MIRRFCLYGFVKNQKYFEPFLYLALLDKLGFWYFGVGMLIGFRELCVIVMEVPSGAIADVLGRRRSMIISHSCYIAAFVTFALAGDLWRLFAAMFLFSIGEAFRTGTHKAMIFTWLKREGRGDEKIKVYGRTRSWSQLGSALSIAIGAALVFTTQRYDIVFLLSTVPYAINIVNFLTYPSDLDGPRATGVDPKRMLQTMFGAVRQSFCNSKLRRALAEAMTFNGLHKSSKDWLGPLLRVFALQLPLFAFLTDQRREAIVIAAVYILLYSLSSYASRHADWVVRRAGSAPKAGTWLWRMNLGAFVLLAAGVLAGFGAVAIVAFVAIAVLQNLWRPIIVARVAQHADESQTATILSIESQTKTLFTAVAAPLLGWTIGLMSPSLRFLPLAILGIAITAIMLATDRNDESSNG
ncbi:MAG: MFS transporter [Phycisphaerae bacterium]|jgi:MFS family permease|nr:MFS transporter [Phycisphaerae bacterium]